MEKLKTEAISFAQTFVTLFLSTLSLGISQMSTEALMDWDTYTTSFIVGLIVSAARTAVKLAWQQTLPESIGGNPKG